MSRRTLPLTDRLYDYLLSATLREHPAQARLRAATADLPEGGMQSAPEQAQLMGLLVELTGARRVLEIGCFTGYSTLAMALALPPDGRLLTPGRQPRLGRARPAGVAGGGRRGSDRGPLRARAREPRPADRGGRRRELRSGLHRRRQEELRCLLRAQPGPGPAGRPDHDRQRALGRCGRRPRQPRPPDPGAARAQRQARQRRSPAGVARLALVPIGRRPRCSPAAARRVADIALPAHDRT